MSIAIDWRSACLTLICAIAVDAYASGETSRDPLLGLWRAVDERSGVRSTIELFLRDDQMFGKITSLKSKDGEDLNPVCESCRGELAGAKVIGAVFISGLRKNGNKWAGGKVVDLRPGALQGVIANCELEVVDGRAKMFGYLWFLGDVDYWVRVRGEPSLPVQ